LVHRQTRTALSHLAPVVMFLIVAIAVTYPTVWFAVGARGRYFMPLYPCISALTALVIDACVNSKEGTWPRRNWRTFVGGIGIVAGIVGVAFAAMSGLPFSWAEDLDQPRWFAAAFALLSFIVSWCCWCSFKSQVPRWHWAAIAAIGIWFGVVNAGVIINHDLPRWNDPTEVVVQLKSLVPESETLVSLGPIEHRFAYYYQAPIRQVDWPTAEKPLPDDADYFVFMRHPGDTAKQKVAGRGRTWYVTPGTVPFAWEELAEIDCNRRHSKDNEITIVLGRVKRPIQPTVSDVTVPQRK